MGESFNAWILETTYIPIRTMFDFIRKKAMNRLDMKGPLCEKWINSFSPSYNEDFHINKGIAVGC